MTGQTASLAEALALLQADLPEVRKDKTAQVKSEKTGQSYSYSYADLAVVSKALLPKLAALGLSFTCKPTMIDGRFVLAYRLLHVSGDDDSGEYPLPSSGTPQAIGSAITYARRYALCSVTGLAPESDDDDAAQVSGQPTEQEKLKGRTAQRRNTRPAANGSARGNGNGQHEAAGPPELPGDGVRMISRQQMADISAVFAQLGISDKGQRLAVAGKVAGRSVTTAAQLTADEAAGLVERLGQIAAAGEDGPLELAHFMDEGAGQ